MTLRAAGWVGATCALGVAVLVGCSASGGSDGGGGGGQFGALNLNRANMDYAAGIGVRAVDAFPPIADLLGRAFVALAQGTPASGAPRAFGGCLIGDATLRWTDTSGDGVWSAGDTARIDLTGCRVHDVYGEELGGSLALTFSAVAAGPPRTVAAQLELALDVLDSQPGTLRGRVAVAATSGDGEHYGLVFQAAGASVVSATGSASYDLGCFDVRDDPHPAVGVERRVAPLGVLRTAGKIMSFDPGGRLLYGPDDLPAGGELGLVSLAIPECAALGVGQGVGDSDGSLLRVVATAPGAMRLDLYRRPGQLDFSTQRGWYDLLAPSALGIVNGTNAVEVAGAVVAALDLPRQVGALGLDLVIGELRGAPVPLCSSGSSAVTFSPPGPATVGQVATLTLTACATGALGDPATLEGTATFTLVGVAGDPTTGTYVLATTVGGVDLTAIWGDGASHVTGAFEFVRDAAPGGVVEQSSAPPPGGGLTLSEGTGAEATEVRLETFGLRSTRAASGAFALAAAGDALSLVASGISGALAVDVSAAVSGTEPEPPGAGDLTISARDGTSVRLQLASGGAVTLALDSDGDGVVDSTIPTTWEALY